MESSIRSEEEQTAKLEQKLRELKTSSGQPAIRETESAIASAEKELALLEAEEQGLNAQILSGKPK